MSDEDIINHFPDAVVLFTPTGEIERANEAAVRLFGLDCDHRTGVIPQILIDERGDGIVDICKALSLSAGGPPVTPFELTGCHSGGATFPVEVALSGMGLADGFHAIARIRDVSHLNRGSRSTDQLLTIAAHELRTPLTSVAGALALLEAGAGGALPEPARRLARLAEANCARLIRLTNDMVDFGKLTLGRWPLTLMARSPADLANEAADGMGGLAEKRQVKLKVESEQDLPFLQVDSDRILQVLTNLLANAIRFSKMGDTVCLRVWSTPKSVSVDIIDHGPGVPEAFRPQLFEKFTQANYGGDRSREGSGLGLAISQSIANLHGGAITHHVTPGGGATFRLELPFPKADELYAGGMRSRSRPPAARRHV